MNSNVEPTFDMDSPAFASDEFRVYEFKVKRCPRVRAHDWTECPFAHPGEKARRRDPRRYAYCGTACPDFRKGVCRRGDACEFAHGVFECWLHPSRYRTQLCTDGKDCARRVCFFAHLPEELRAADTSGCPQPSLAGGRPVSPTGPPLPSSSGGMPGMGYSMPPAAPAASSAVAAAAQQQAATSAAMVALLGATLQNPTQQAAAMLANSTDPTVQALLASIRAQQDQQNVYSQQLQHALAASQATGGALPNVQHLAAAASAASAVAQARAVQGAGVLMSSFGEIGSSPAFATADTPDVSGAGRNDPRRSSAPEQSLGSYFVGRAPPPPEVLRALLAQRAAQRPGSRRQSAASASQLPPVDEGGAVSMEQAFEHMQMVADAQQAAGQPAQRMRGLAGSGGSGGDWPFIGEQKAEAGQMPNGQMPNPSPRGSSAENIQRLPPGLPNGKFPNGKPRNPAIDSLVANLPRSLSDLALDRHGEFVEELLTA